MKLTVTLRTLKSFYIKQSLYRPGEALKFPGCADNQHFKVVRLSALCTGRLSTPPPSQEISQMFISVRG
jgi:hypothetical protein